MLSIVLLLVYFLNQPPFQRISQQGVQFYESVQICFTSHSQWTMRNTVWLMIHTSSGNGDANIPQLLHV